MKTNQLLKISLLACTVIFSAANANAQKSSGYTVNGTITNQQTGTVYLSHETADQQTVIDSAQLKNGSFEFKGTVKEPIFYNLYLKDSRRGKSFLLENSKITFTGNKDSLYFAKISGAKTNALYMSFYEVYWKPVTVKAGDIYRRLDMANQKGKVKLDSATRKGFDDEFAKLDLKNDTIVNQFVKANPNSVAAAAVIVDRYVNYPYLNKAQALFPSLAKNVQESVFGKQIQHAVALAAKTAVGKAAPAISMADSTGKIVHLSDFKGKYVLIDFWASWCGPCRKENPNVVAAYKKYHDMGFEILGVSLDNNKAAWLKAIQADGLTWNHVSDLKGWSNDAAATYGVKSVPASFLLDKEGKVVGKDLRGEELNKTLAGIFTGKTL